PPRPNCVDAVEMKSVSSHMVIVHTSCANYLLLKVYRPKFERVYLREYIYCSAFGCAIHRRPLWEYLLVPVLCCKRSMNYEDEYAYYVIIVSPKPKTFPTPKTNK
ncbi:unnamed protein product, partial [Ectocarpus sp. 13 AM-2016]